MNSHATAPGAILTIILIACSLVLTGCNTRLSKVVRAEPSAQQGYVEVEGGHAGLVEVYRNGRRLDPRTPLALQPGDRVMTGPDAGAVIRFANGGEAVLAPETHVRLGSLEVFFGRVLADLRGLFQVEDDTMVASVEGTRFLFEARPGQRSRVAVLEGRVRCQPKSGGWEPIRLGAGQVLTARPGDPRPPRLSRLSSAELHDIERWSSGIRQAARQGFCCARGRVHPALSNQCRGHFDSDERRAQHLCQSGWCCRGGKVSASIRADCRGAFHGNRAAAERACAPAPPPPEPVTQGWCCLHGNLKQTDSKYCKAVGGRFYSNGTDARRRCLRVVQ